MEKKVLKIKFMDFYPGHKPENDWYYRKLSEIYRVELTETPDYIIDGGLGHEHCNHKYDRCIKIVTIGENYAPDFNLFDYAIGFDDIKFGDRYLRAPLFVFYKEFALLEKRKQPSDEELLNRDFCSFVVSDFGGDPCRIDFFKELSKYKKVASGGGVFNNVGGRVASKAAFCSKYKFNIAFENSSSPGYTTEKIMQALAFNTVPIYFGNPYVDKDFTPQCMIWVKDRSEMQHAIERIKYLDTHDDDYLSVCHAECLQNPVAWHETRLIDFLKHIFDQPLENAKRLIPYGNQVKYRSRYERLYRIDDAWRKPALWIYNLKHKFSRYK